MWKREDLMKLSEQERLEKLKTMEHHILSTQDEIYAVKKAGYGKYIGYAGDKADVWLYPEEWKNVELPF